MDPALPPPPSLPPIVIGPREIYDALVRLQASLERLMIMHEGVARQQADQEMRLRALERARWPLPALAALMALGSLVLQFLKFQ